MRAPRSDQSPRGADWTALGGPRRRPSVAAIAAAEDVDRLRQRVLAKIRPEHIKEDQLRVSRLPEHEIGETEFARGTDQQVRSWKFFGVEIGLENLVIEIAGLAFACGNVMGKTARGAEDFVLAAIVECDREIELGVVLGARLRIFDNLGDVLLQTIGPPMTRTRTPSRTRLSRSRST